jgi:hypothetical protein
MSSGKAVLRMNEFIHTEMVCFQNAKEQMILRALKERGAPIKGELILEADPSYIWTRFEGENPVEEAMIITWRLKS